MRRARRPKADILACLCLALVALSGHARRANSPEPAALGDALAEVLVQRNGEVVTRGSAVAVATREEQGESACYLLTAGHILSLNGSPSDVVVVLRPDHDTPRRFRGELLHQADGDDRDLAVLRVAGLRCRPARVDARVEPDGDVWLAGFAAQGTPRVWSGHVRDARAGASRWTVDSLVSEGTSGGGVFDARTGGLIGLIQGYWTVRLITGGRVAGEMPVETAAIIPISRVRALLQEWGIADLLE